MHIHFIGIGGIGMSALARYFLAHENKVSGSDLAASQITNELTQEGAGISIGPHKASNIMVGVDLVIYSAAVASDNPELKEAKTRKIKCQTYAQALGDLTKKYFTIAVSGMHGKSTTTAMIGLMMEAAGLDPTVIVGTKVRWNNSLGDSGIPLAPGTHAIPAPRSLIFSPGDKAKKLRARRAALRKRYTRIAHQMHPLAQEFYSNFRLGRSKYLVIEADEWNASFLSYWPKIIVLINIEEEHLDYYKNLRKIKETFKEYIGHLGKDGVLVASGEDENIREIISNFKFLPISSRILDGEAIGIISKKTPNAKFKIKKYSAKNRIVGLNLKVSGRHNLMNAYAAVSVGRILGIPDAVSIKALNNFNGTWRRMEYKGEVNGAKIYDDYGHHPTEIKTTLEGAIATIASGKLWCVFQPHQYQRTHLLFDKFVKAFSAADRVIMLPIYSVAGREKESIKKKVSSEKLAAAIKEERGRKEDWGNKENQERNKGNKEEGEEIIFLPDFNQAAEYLKNNLGRGDVCVVMGAGDVYWVTEMLMASRCRS